jgi:hypothetical protein
MRRGYLDDIVISRGDAKGRVAVLDHVTVFHANIGVGKSAVQTGRGAAKLETLWDSREGTIV